MGNITEKICPSCNQTFTCNTEDITQCQCFSVVLTTSAKEIIAQQFNNCICKECLIKINQSTAS